MELAKKYADHVIDSSKGDGLEQVLELTDGKGVDVVSECSGDPAVVQYLPDYLRDGGWEKGSEGGRIHLQGDYPFPWAVEKYFKWFVKNFTLSVNTNGSGTGSVALNPTGGTYANGTLITVMATADSGSVLIS